MNAPRRLALALLAVALLLAGCGGDDDAAEDPIETVEPDAGADGSDASSGRTPGAAERPSGEGSDDTTDGSTSSASGSSTNAPVETYEPAPPIESVVPYEE